MARLTQSLIKKQFEWTSKCFKQAVLTAYKDVLPKSASRWGLNQIKKYIMYREVSEVNGTWYGYERDVNEFYLTNIVKLDTEKIEIIIDAYNKGKQHRSPLTIEVLTSELLDRALRSETRRRHGK
jgi:hypothetical protein